MYFFLGSVVGVFVEETWGYLGSSSISLNRTCFSLYTI
jgi:hypothetical protein